MAAAKTAPSRDLAAEIAFLTRALKAPTLRESVHGYAGAQRRSQFLMVIRVSNRCCHATFLITSAPHSSNCRASARHDEASRRRVSDAVFLLS